MNHRFSAGLLLVLLMQTPVQNPAARSCSASVDQCVSAVTAKVRERFPNAELFQVSILGLLPDSLKGILQAEAIRSSYYIGEKDRYVQAVQRLAQDGKTADLQVLEESAKPEPCTRGYPSPSSQVCAQQIELLESPPVPLDIARLSSQERLSDLLIKNGMSSSGPVDVSFVAAKRLGESLKQSSSPLVANLSNLDPGRPVVSVTPRGKSRTQVGPTTYFDLLTAKVLGTIRPNSTRPPPSLRP
jgi:hypothetical protein